MDRGRDPGDEDDGDEAEEPEPEEAWRGDSAYPHQALEGPEARMARDELARARDAARAAPIYRLVVERYLRSLRPKDSRMTLEPFRPGPESKESRW
ncbi:MAG TPA: hypothetical protein VJN95_08800 [Gemmatimonadales bacterium]|nr:hypothetical protein [Gemmatimonadales bacterium]